MRSRLREALWTARRAVLCFCAITSLFWVLGVIALGRVFTDGPLEPFKLGNVPIPKFAGAGFHNLDVVIFCAVGIVAVAIALIVRYMQHRPRIEALRARGITDFDQDGRPDTFTDRFLDDL